MITKHNVQRDILYIKMVPLTVLPTSSSHLLLASSVSLTLHPPRQISVFYKSKHEFKIQNSLSRPLVLLEWKNIKIKKCAHIHIWA